MLRAIAPLPCAALGAGLLLAASSWTDVAAFPLPPSCGAFCPAGPLTTVSQTIDPCFKACGGFIMLATGFRMCKIKQFPVADMIPAMVLIFPIAIFWNDCVTPAVNMLAGMVH